MVLIIVQVSKWLHLCWVLSLSNREITERQTYLDLREAETANHTESSLAELLQSLEFEDILQYAHIPAHPFMTSADPSTAVKANRNSHELPSASVYCGRNDFSRIFDILGKKGVKKIIRLIVEDNGTVPHTDEVIEELKRFEIEEWEWKKLDISTAVIQLAAHKAKKLTLWSSGNHSVLRDWSSCDGLRRLRKVFHLNYYGFI